MKKLKQYTIIMLAALLFISLEVLSVSASQLKGTSFDVGYENSGYQIIVPNFIRQDKVEVRDVDGKSYIVEAVVMNTPDRDKNGNYAIFDIVTTVENAHSVISYPGTFTEGQLGSFEGVFNKGSVIYSPSFSIEDKSLKDVVGSYPHPVVFTFDFAVHDTLGEMVFYAEKMYFVFQNDDAAALAQEAIAQPTASQVLVNGEEVSFDAYNINGNNYFKLRDIAKVLSETSAHFDVSWDATNNAIALTTNQDYTDVGGELSASNNIGNKNAIRTDSAIYLNGAKVDLTAYLIEGNNYFKLRDIAKAIDFSVEWDGERQTIMIDSSVGYQVAKE